MALTHLQRLEAESIHIFREVAASFSRPVMLYSIGKDSSVMMHLAMKAFYPAKPPFPFLHVDTTWKFQAMYAFRQKMADDLGIDLLVHVNPEAVVAHPSRRARVRESDPGGPQVPGWLFGQVQVQQGEQQQQ